MSKVIAALWLPISLLIIGWFYNVCLWFHIYGYASVLLSLVAYILSTFFYYKKVLSHYKHVTSSGLYNAVLLIIILWLLYHCFPLYVKYGQWDAWAIWNLHAKFLASGPSWTELFHEHKAAHVDYPLLLPSVIAFGWSASSSTAEVIPFMVHTIIAMSVVVVLYAALIKQGLVFSVLGVMPLLCNEFILQQFMAEYADTLLALNFLSLLVVVTFYKSLPSRVWAILIGLLTGACCYTKNEGIILSIITLVVIWPELKGHKALFLLVFGPICLLVFLPKIVFHLSSDMVPNGATLQAYKNRLPIINAFIQSQLIPRYTLIFALIGTGLLSRLGGNKYSMVTKAYMILIVATLAYYAIYILTPQDLVWHLNTSAERLVHQLIPASLFVAVMAISYRLKLVSE